MDPIIIVIIAVGATLLASLSRPASPQYIVVPIEPVQTRGSGCAPLIAVAIAVLIIIALTPS